MKRILMLGGTPALIPVIRAAKKLGIYVITADYIPANEAHKYSDEYCNVSVVDQEAVLSKARSLRVDGILSFACDAGCITTAYVQEQLGLPSIGPYESVCILQHKDLFRQFLRENGFNTPRSWSFTSFDDAIVAANEFHYPIIVKPTDSNGSKGVTRVDVYERLEDALRISYNYSKTGNILVEDFIEKKGHPSDSDCFSVSGKLVFTSFSSQRFDEKADGAFTPAAFSWPSSYSIQEKAYLKEELQRLMFLLSMNTTIYNVETRIGNDNKPYIMECSPRGGGNRIAEVIRYATGVDLIENSVRAAVGMPLSDLEQMPYIGHWAEIIIHSNRKGIFHGIEILDGSYRKCIVDLLLYYKEGDYVNSFLAGSDAIGSIVFNFESNKQMEDALSSQSDWLRIKVS